MIELAICYSASSRTRLPQRRLNYLGASNKIPSNNASVEKNTDLQTLKKTAEIFMFWLLLGAKFLNLLIIKIVFFSPLFYAQATGE